MLFYPSLYFSDGMSHATAAINTQLDSFALSAPLYIFHILILLSFAIISNFNSEWF